jgi:predicted signal transduction protein with EAL and GGDEF domain
MLPSGSNDRLQDLQKEVLEAIACGELLKSIADLLCLRVESLAPDVIRSILPVDVHGLVHPLVGASIGIADTQAHHLDLVELSKRADMALYMANSGGAGRTMISEPATRRSVRCAHSFPTHV